MFKLKRHLDGSIHKHKARLVAKDFLQTFGKDFSESFASFAKMVSMRILLTIIAKQKWKIHQMDINNAFLHGFLNEKLYLSPPQGCNAPKGHMCKLKKVLYGLKQAPMQ